MGSDRRTLLTFATSAVLVLLAAGSGSSWALPAPSTTQIVYGDGESGSPAISGDGEVVVFASAASDLVEGDTNGRRDAFVWRRSTALIERVSLTSGGSQAPTGIDPDVDISADGRVVAFSSLDALVPADTNGRSDVYVRDLERDVTELVSMTDGEGLADGGSGSPVLDADGSSVAFLSAADNLVLGTASSFVGAFVRDRQLGTTELASRFVAPLVGHAGIRSSGRANHDVEELSISGDGRFVAFTTRASNLTLMIDENGQRDIYMYDRQGTYGTELISVNQMGTHSGNRTSVDPTVSSDGRYVAFASSSNSLTFEGSNQLFHIYVRDRLARVTQKVSIGSTAAEANQNSFEPDISPDGRFIVYRSLASNLAQDNNELFDVFVADRLTLRTVRESDARGEGSAASDDPVISADGRVIAYVSLSTIFLRDRGTCAPIEVEPLCTSPTAVAASAGS